MPDYILKPKIELEENSLSSISSEEYLPAFEGDEVHLPVATEVSPLPAESRVVVHSDPRSAGADRFKLVRIRLQNLQATRGLKRLLITSPLPADGKSTVALNLATVLSDKGKHAVLLLEADVYRPSLLKKLGIKPWGGLTDSYKRGTDPMMAIRRIDPLGFYLLPAGRPTEDGGSLLQSNFFSELVKGLSSNFFRWILIDSPPTTPIADILVLKGIADGTLLIARAGRTPREAIEETTRNLGRDHIVGIILNDVEGLEHTYSQYYGYVKPETQAKPEANKGLLHLG